MRHALKQLGVRAVVALSVGLSGWTSVEAQSLTWLGMLPSSGWSSAYGVSADGRAVVGGARNTSGQYRAFRWTAETGMQDLGTLGGFRSRAYGVSADGRAVVGWENRRAFWWMAETRMQDLNQVFAPLLTNGSELVAAYAISLDRRHIVGWGYNGTTEREEGFLLDTWRTGDTNGDGCINNADLLTVLFAFGTPGTSPSYHEDINRDGVVNNADLLVVLFNFGQGC